MYLELGRVLGVVWWCGLACNSKNMQPRIRNDTDDDVDDDHDDDDAHRKLIEQHAFLSTSTKTRTQPRVRLAGTAGVRVSLIWCRMLFCSLFLS